MEEAVESVVVREGVADNGGVGDWESVVGREGELDREGVVCSRILADPLQIHLKRFYACIVPVSHFGKYFR